MKQKRKTPTRKTKVEVNQGVVKDITFNASTRSDVALENLSFDQECSKILNQTFDDFQHSENTNPNSILRATNENYFNPKSVSLTGPEYIEKLRKRGFDGVTSLKKQREFNKIHGVKLLIPKASFSRLVAEIVRVST